MEENFIQLLHTHKDFLIYESRYENNDGKIIYRLNSIDVTGNSFRNLLTLDYEPSYFLIPNCQVNCNTVE